MKRILSTLLLLFAVTLLSSQSVHFGTAAVSSDGEFNSFYSDDSTTGRLLGASNSFPASTVVKVTNPANGKSVSVTIVKRLSQPGLFLVLSPEAGKSLDLPSDDVMDIQAVEQRENTEKLNSYTEDQPFSSDPDLNPSAELASAGTEANPPAADTTADSGTTAAPETTAAPDTTASADTTAAPTTTASDTTAAAGTEAASDTTAATGTGAATPPKGSNVNEYIPPLVMNSEGNAYKEGYDPMVLLDSGDDSGKGKVVEMIDKPDALMDAINSPSSGADVPLPEKFTDSDLPDTYEAASPGDKTAQKAESAAVPSGTAPAESLDSGEIDSSVADASVDDLLITKPAVPAADKGQTVVTAPDLTEKPEALTMNNVSEPEASVPESPEKTGPVVIEAGEEATPAETPEETGEVVVAKPLEPAKSPEIAEVVVAEPKAETPTATEEKSEPKTEQPVIVKPEEKTEDNSTAMTSPAEKPQGNTIYFLTPGDFRPPPHSEKKEDKEKDKEKPQVLPKTVERSKLEGMMVRELKNGGSYLQLGTYSSVDVLYSAIQNISGSYPKIVLTVGSDGKQLYKLLIGPISRDEKGIVITRFRSLGYSDAFLYSPH